MLQVDQHNSLFFLLVGEYVSFLTKDFFENPYIILLLKHLPACFVCQMFGLCDFIKILLNHQLLVVPRLFNHTLVVALVE